MIYCLHCLACKPSTRASECWKLFLVEFGLMWIYVFNMEHIKFDLVCTLVPEPNIVLVTLPVLVTAKGRKFVQFHPHSLHPGRLLRPNGGWHGRMKINAVIPLSCWYPPIRLQHGFIIKYDNHVTSLATIYSTCKHYTRLYIHNMFRLQCAIIMWSRIQHTKLHVDL
jgi:hypothetical protein